MLRVKAPYKGWDVTTCPVCYKSFVVGYHHPADQKLNHHMKTKQKNRKEHLDVYSTMRWPLNGGDIKLWEDKIHP